MLVSEVNSWILLNMNYMKVFLKMVFKTHKKLNKTMFEAKNSTNCFMLSGISCSLRSLCSDRVMFAGQYGQRTPCRLQGHIFRETYCLVSYWSAGYEIWSSKQHQHNHFSCSSPLCLSTSTKMNLSEARCAPKMPTCPRSLKLCAMEFASYFIFVCVCIWCFHIISPQLSYKCAPWYIE